MNNTLLAHLISRFTAQPENIATESLCYILTRSMTAQKAFLRQLEKSGFAVNEDLTYRTQSAGTDGSIPDLVGVDSAGRPIVIIESKFWAGLTDNQPEQYIKRLPDGTKSILLFIAPTARFTTLWPELLRRACLNESNTEKLTAEFFKINITENNILAVISWRCVLDAMIMELQTVGEHDVAADGMQLRGLCNQMDTEAFLPLHTEELSSSIGRRILHFCDLINDAAESAVKNGLATYEGRVSGGQGYYARPFRLGKNGCYLYFDASSWAKQRETPIWLEVKDSDWKYSEALGNNLRSSSKGIKNPPEILLINNQIKVPIYLPTHRERDKVIECILDQIKNVYDLLI